MAGTHHLGQLTSFTLRVTAPAAAAWKPQQMGHFLQAFVYDTLTLGNPSLADQIHHATGLKPFTASLPCSWPPPSTRARATRATPLVALRVTALTAEVHHALMTGLLRHGHGSSQLSLGPHRVEIQQVHFPQEGSPLATATSYAALWAGPLARQIRMRFLTPTSCRAGQRELPFPLPLSVYRGLWRKWQAFAPPTLCLPDTLMAAVERSLFPTHYALHTAVMQYHGTFPAVGCVGTCTFTLLPGLSAAEHRAITTLSRFAAYAGVGMKTTAGMGQTQVWCDTHEGDRAPEPLAIDE